MKLDDAFLLLKRAGITNSKDQVRKWIRQGRIRADMNSKKEGYEINDASLNYFIEMKIGSHRDYFYKEFNEKYNTSKYKSQISELQREVEKLKERNNLFRQKIKEFRKGQHSG